MLPSPPLTDPDVRISRIRFLTRRVRSWNGVLVNDRRWRQGVAREHGAQARPRQVTMPAAPPEPFQPDPHELVAIPPDPAAVAADTIVGTVTPDHPGQVGALFPEWTVAIVPAPRRYRGQRTRIPVFRRDLANHVLALQRFPPDMGETQKVERRSRRGRVRPFRALEPKVNEARLGRVKLKPKPTNPLA